MPGRGADSGYFLVEFDGVTTLEASEVSEAKLKHAPVQIAVGGREKPRQVRGKSEVEVVTVKHARMLNNAGGEVWAWFNNFHRGIAVERRNLRIIQLDEDGIAIGETVDLIDCVPTDFTLEAHKADAKEASYFSFAVQPEDFDYIA